MLSDLRETLECPGCAELFEEPKALPCGHVLCTKCTLFGKSNRCTVCSKEFALPLPDAHHIKKILDRYNKILMKNRDTTDNGSLSDESKSALTLIFVFFQSSISFS